MSRRKTERVLILTNTLKSGGAEKQSVLLTKAMSQAYETTLVVYYGDQVDQKLIQLLGKGNFKVSYLKGGHAAKLYSLFKLFRANRHSAIFSYLATTNVINAVLGKIAGVPLLVGGIRTDAISGIKFYIQRFLHNHLLTYTIFNNSLGRKNLCARGFNDQKALTIHNGIEIGEPQMPGKKTGNTIQLISVGRFVPQKDYPTALKAFEIAQRQMLENSTPTELRYTIIGYGSLEEQIREYIKTHGLSDSVSVVTDPPDLRKYLAEADLYLSSSLSEGLSNSIMEAMEMSLPVVATNVGDTAQLVVPGSNGYLAEASDVQTIAEKIKLLALDPARRQEMGTNSYRLLQEKFSIPVFKTNYLQLIHDFDAR